MDRSHQTENEQATLWNGAARSAWVASQELLDRMFQPFEEALVEAVSRGPGCRVLDVGCGTGSTTLAAARLLGAEGRCIGIDISKPMIDAARTRAEQANLPTSFLCANAQEYAFEPASFDMILSRFGVMFFDDSIRAFANLRQAAEEDAGLCFVAWRSAEENAFMTTAERAAATLLPNLPTRRPDEPGQFAFANRQRTYDILEKSGWNEIDIRPMDVACTLPETELATYFTRFGPAGRMLQQADERTRAHVVKTVRAAFDPYVHGADVRFTAACWMVSAQARSASDSAGSRDDVRTVTSATDGQPQGEQLG